MVADPVQATIETLRYYYYQTSEFLSNQQTKLNTTIDNFSVQEPLPLAKPTKLERIWGNIDDKRFYYGIGLSLISSSLIYYYKFHKINKPFKRRVPKLANGARRDVVLVIGSPTEPLTRLICLDLEKRGFIVYLTLLDEKDIKYIESNPITDDMNYLNLKSNDKIGTTNNLETQLLKFNKLLQTSVIPFAGAESHNLQLKSVIFTPSLYFPIGPIENILISSWTKINDRFHLYLLMLSCGLIQIIRNQQAKTILINSSIISGLNMPYHAPESIFTNQLKNLFTILTRELKQLNLSVTQIRLGNLHISNQAQNSNLKISNIINSELASWNHHIKSLYGDSFSKSQLRSNPIKATGGQGTSLKELYHTIFDLIYSKNRNPPVIYCGIGSRSYDIIARILPDSWLEKFIA